MKVTLKLAGALRDIAGYTETRVQLTTGATVKQLVDAWQQQLGDRMEEQALQYQWAHATTQVSVIINDEMVPQSSALEAILKEGDVVTLLPIVTGG